MSKEKRYEVVRVSDEFYVVRLTKWWKRWFSSLTEMELIEALQEVPKGYKIEFVTRLYRNYDRFVVKVSKSD